MRRRFVEKLFLGSVVSVLCPCLALAAGTIYLVLGSDTAIWDGMDVARFDCLYRLELYTSPTGNAYQVMDPAFRRRYLDSFGQPLKMTWWMMAGNIFRYARNTDVPLPNIMTMYLMKKYHGPEVVTNGDELSLHYHTFIWSDYDGDGRWWWNQARSFRECRDDFEITLAQLLLEEHVFPVSFRSGWHYMDNDWQRYLNTILPFCMHNDYPSRGIDNTEPLDNNLDWSRAPSQWVPYHPSEQDYQVPGEGAGWNVRSAHFRRVLAGGLLEEMFAAAARGLDQVACIWGHLPETDFPTNIGKVDSALHAVASRYPEVRFRYCTAIEGMQRWLGTGDTTAPALQVDLLQEGQSGRLVIRSDEPIFQPAPVVAFKDLYENYGFVPATANGDRSWVAVLPPRPLAKVGVAVCDTVGNQTLWVHRLLPDDLYCDDESGQLQPVSGRWTVSPQSAWGGTALVADVGKRDSAVVRWYPQLEEERLYNVFVQVPEGDGRSQHACFRLFSAGREVHRKEFLQPLPPRTWVYLGTSQLRPDPGTFLEMVAYGDSAGGRVLVDVAKFTPLVRAQDLYAWPQTMDLGEVVERDTVFFSVRVENRGTEETRVLGCTSASGAIRAVAEFPLTVPPMGSILLCLSGSWPEPGKTQDSLFIWTEDPWKPRIGVLVTARVQRYFVVVDNEDSLRYREFGEWHYSVAQAYGPTSRYAPLQQWPRAWAAFTTSLRVSGVYDILEIVPTTQNATNHALYVIRVAGEPLDSVVVDQNSGSGSWALVGRYFLPAQKEIEVRVIDDGGNTNPRGAVLRADAIKFALVQEVSFAEESGRAAFPRSFRLGQSYPNPCNGRAIIPFELPREGWVELSVYDSAGRRVAILVSGRLPAGEHRVSWDFGEMPSGLYLYRLSDGKNRASGKLVVIR